MHKSDTDDYGVIINNQRIFDEGLCNSSFSTETADGLDLRCQGICGYSDNKGMNGDNFRLMSIHGIYIVTDLYLNN